MEVTHLMIKLIIMSSWCTYEHRAHVWKPTDYFNKTKQKIHPVPILESTKIPITLIHLFQQVLSNIIWLLEEHDTSFNSTANII